MVFSSPRCKRTGTSGTHVNFRGVWKCLSHGVIVTWIYIYLLKFNLYTLLSRFKQKNERKTELIKEMAMQIAKYKGWVRSSAPGPRMRWIHCLKSALRAVNASTVKHRHKSSSIGHFHVYWLPFPSHICKTKSEKGTGGSCGGQTLTGLPMIPAFMFIFLCNPHPPRLGRVCNLLSTNSIRQRWLISSRASPCWLDEVSKHVGQVHMARNNTRLQRTVGSYSQDPARSLSL